MAGIDSDSAIQSLTIGLWVMTGLTFLVAAFALYRHLATG